MPGFRGRHYAVLGVYLNANGDHEKQGECPERWADEELQKVARADSPATTLFRRNLTPPRAPARAGPRSPSPTTWTPWNLYCSTSFPSIRRLNKTSWGPGEGIWSARQIAHGSPSYIRQAGESLIKEDRSECTCEHCCKLHNILHHADKRMLCILLHLWHIYENVFNLFAFYKEMSDLIVWMEVILASDNLFIQISILYLISCMVTFSLNYNKCNKNTNYVLLKVVSVFLFIFNLHSFKDLIFQTHDSRKANNVGEEWV